MPSSTELLVALRLNSDSKSMLKGSNCRGGHSAFCWTVFGQQLDLLTPSKGSKWQYASKSFCNSLIELLDGSGARAASVSSKAHPCKVLNVSSNTFLHVKHAPFITVYCIRKTML